MQLFAERHETPERVLAATAADGTGVVWIAHVVAALAGFAAHTAQAAAVMKIMMLRRMILDNSILIYSSKLPACAAVSIATQRKSALLRII
jgi:hypothetical protein